MADRVIGIDLGTTFSCLAIMEGGKPLVIENSEGTRTTASVVAFAKSGERLVGQVAKRQAITNPSRTVQSIKREMGSTYQISIDGITYGPEQISAMILQKIKADAEAFLGETVNKAVITCPAYFDDAQRQATRNAGEIAGLEVLRIINEPTAAALAYGLSRPNLQSTILVFDLGGGTFDVSILRMLDGVFEVKATRGNNRLGGDDFDQCVVDWLKTEFLSQHSIDVSNDLIAMQRLKESAERAKIELSSIMVSEIHLPFLTADEKGAKHLETTLTRAKFNDLTSHLVEATMAPLEAALADAQLGPDGIDQIILVGGSTRIPAVQDSLRRIFGKDPVKSVNPDEAVAMGAAIQSSILAGEQHDVLLLDVTPLSLGLETAGGIFTKIIEHNTTIPTSRTMNFTTTEDGQTSVEIHILQGERELARYNKSLAKFQLVEIPAAPRGVARIEVTFDINADGIVDVSARDSGSGIRQSLKIERSAGLSSDEIDDMRKEADQFAQQDRELKDEISIKIQAQSLSREAERTLERYSQRVAPPLVAKVQTALSAIHTALKGEDTANLHSLVAGLDAALLDLGRAIYMGARDSSAVSRENE